MYSSIYMHPYCTTYSRIVCINTRVKRGGHSKSMLCNVREASIKMSMHWKYKGIWWPCPIGFKFGIAMLETVRALFSILSCRCIHGVQPRHSCSHWPACNLQLLFRSQQCASAIHPLLHSKQSSLFCCAMQIMVCVSCVDWSSCISNVCLAL